MEVITLLWGKLQFCFVWGKKRKPTCTTNYDSFHLGKRQSMECSSESSRKKNISLLTLLKEKKCFYEKI